MKKITTGLVFALVMSFLSLTAFAVSSTYYGFEGPESVTDTQNEYMFDSGNALVVANKEVMSFPNYGELRPGSTIYLPLMAYVGGAKPAVPVTDKMIKTDSLDFSYKALVGAEHLGDLEFIDGKKLKLAGVNPGIYLKIPLETMYSGVNPERITLSAYLSVNGRTFPQTESRLLARISNPVTNINSNTVYGAKTPTMFKVGSKYTGPVTFDFGGKVTYNVKVAPNDNYFLALSREPDKNVSQMYPKDYIEYYNFTEEQDDFPYYGTLQIPIKLDSFAKKGEEPSIYVYKIQGKNLIAMSEGLTFDSKTNTLRIKTGELENYIVSGAPLKREVDQKNGNVLKAGYAADIAEDATTEVTTSKTSTASSSAASSSKQASSAASSSSSSSSVAANTLDDYVPEEGAISNDNVGTGREIHADNFDSENPNTSDINLTPIIVLNIAALAVMVAVLRKKR